jgi:16S rRNA (cytosine1402-N4)-methyltransferase
MSQGAADLHVPIMVREVIALLAPKNGGIIVDGTLGLGGHAENILNETADGQVVGFEWDRQAAELAAERLYRFAGRFRLINGSYADIDLELAACGIDKVDGVLVDLGVSSLQIDRGERGFSFRQDAPLDMRMNKDLKRTAADIVNAATEAELADIFYFYGEERQARRIAGFIVEERKRALFVTTIQLADLVARAVPKRFHPDRIHVATRVFQGLRIAVNRELDNLSQLLKKVPDVLRAGGVFCVISFHSLEDRMVKQAFKSDDRLRVLTGKPLQADDNEKSVNPRARSAKLRGAVRSEDRS